MTETILIAVISALTSGGVLAFAQFMIARHDDKQGIKSTLKKLEKDGLRTQMLLMILLRPEEHKEILTLGERYFKKPPEGLGANWYMTNIFEKWVEEECDSSPEWFKKEV